jgi:urease accessory protein
MDPLAFVHSLQFADSFFPVGAFAYSDGLETAALSGEVRDAATLEDWLNHFLVGVFVPCEGLAVLKSIRALAAKDLQALAKVDEELTAIRPAAASRAASIGIGKRLLSLYTSISADDSFPEIARNLPEGNAATAYAAVFFHRGIPERDAILAFGYSRLAGIVSASLRLISIGHQQGQRLLSMAIVQLPAAAERILETAGEPLRSFNPRLDIQQMNHQYLYSRLFRS